jgi:hypothetical protein
MHVGNRLDFAGSQNAQNSLTQNYCRQENMETTENTKRYIDFAAKMVLTEFWSKVGM